MRATGGDAPLRPGEQITASLRLVRPLGAGGMGRVWIAEHTGLRAQVVVKFMAAELAENPDALARFSREAAAASQVRSPHVVHVSDYGVALNGLPYIAMELLEGRDLGQVIARYGTLDPSALGKIITQVARALARAHEKGIIHRDIKPDNIFLLDSGGGEIFAKVLDFGVAKSLATDGAKTTGMTRAGAMIGTPAYMSPEQVLGDRAIDHRSDLWSLGVVAFEALTATLPFGGETVGAISVAICGTAPPRPSQINASIGPAVDAWFVRACAREPRERYGSALELAAAFSSAVESDAARWSSEATEPAVAPTRQRARTSPPISVTDGVDEPTVVMAGRSPTTNGAISRPSETPRAAPTRRSKRMAAALVGTAVVVTLSVLAIVMTAGRHAPENESATHFPAVSSKQSEPAATGSATETPPIAAPAASVSPAEAAPSASAPPPVAGTPKPPPAKPKKKKHVIE